MKQRVIKAAAYLRERVSEHRLQVLVLQHIEALGRLDVYAFAIPNAARRSPQLAARMRAEGLRPGIADLCIMLEGGRTCWLELKDGRRGTQSDAQKGFQAICGRLGHDYAVARSLDEAIMTLKQWGVLK
jgi:hypothetical protein